MNYLQLEKNVFAFTQYNDLKTWFRGHLRSRKMTSFNRSYAALSQRLKKVKGV